MRSLFFRCHNDQNNIRELNDGVFVVFALCYSAAVVVIVSVEWEAL